MKTSKDRRVPREEFPVLFRKILNRLVLLDEEESGMTGHFMFLSVKCRKEYRMSAEETLELLWRFSGMLHLMEHGSVGSQRLFSDNSILVCSMLPMKEPGVFGESDYLNALEAVEGSKI